MPRQACSPSEVIMQYELHRQLVHLSGVVFIILAQFAGRVAAVYFLMIAATLFIYSLQIRREWKRMHLLAKIETRLRDVALKLERHDVPFPFTGAIWFYLSCGICFLVFPLHIASAATIIMAVGDSLSTIIGTKYGKHKTFGDKTEEGTLAYFLGGLLCAFFLPPLQAVFAAGLGALLELVPDLRPFRGYRKRGIIDDNWLVPIAVGLVLLLLPSLA